MTRTKWIGVIRRQNGYKVGELVYIENEHWLVLAVGDFAIEVVPVSEVIQNLNDEIQERNAEVDRQSKIRMDLEKRIVDLKKEYQDAQERLARAGLKLGLYL